VNQDHAFRRLLRGSLIALTVCAVLVTLCYFLVDRPVAFFVRDRQINRIELLKWLTYPPPYLESLAPLVLVGLMLRRAWGPLRRWEQTLFAICVSLLLTVAFEGVLKPAFGRTWPATWINNNPSLLNETNHAYGFFPFRKWDWHEGGWYDSFPSGHTARMMAILSVVWIASVWWRWACVLAALAIAVGLIGMDYHFVGDVIGGGFLGGIVGTYTAQFCGVGALQTDLSFRADSPGAKR
jgi:membrane-associated phospholipid phosphatase